MSDKLSFRFAQRKDAALIFDFIMRIAEYEKMTDEVLNTPEMVEKQLFDEHRAEVIFAVADGREVAWASFSSKMIIGVIVWVTLVAVAVAVVVRSPALGRLSLASVAVVLILVQGISIARPIKHAVFGTPNASAT